MSTNKQTTTTNQYDPIAKGAYDSGTTAWSNQAKNFAQNPYGNPQFQLEQQMGTRQAQGLGQTAMNNVTQNATASGFGGGINSPYQQEMMQNQGRANSGLQAQLGFINPSQMANQRQQYSMGLLQGYQPLQTGQNQVQKTSGLGTWLPQVASAGLGLAGQAMAGGFGGGGGMSPTGAAGLGSQYGPSGMSGPMNSLMNGQTNPWFNQNGGSMWGNNVPGGGGYQIPGLSGFGYG